MGLAQGLPQEPDPEAVAKDVECDPAVSAIQPEWWPAEPLPQEPMSEPDWDIEPPPTCQRVYR